MTRNQSGFTILELAIVVTIIALIAGGILAGQTLVRAANNRDIYTRANQYITAEQQFFAKYQGLPGDLYNATSIWGNATGGAIADGYDATCAALGTASTSKTTCNGDGNGIIFGTTSTTSNNGYYETFRAWQHLANAGMIDGSYTGVTSPTGYYTAVPDSNVPAGSITGTGYSFLNLNSGYPGVFSNTGQVISFGGLQPASITNASAISAADAWAIDKKVDDGLPGSGRIFTYDNTVYSNCTTSASASTAMYNTSTTVQRACSLWFQTGF